MHLLLLGLIHVCTFVWFALLSYSGCTICFKLCCSSYCLFTEMWSYHTITDRTTLITSRAEAWIIFKILLFSFKLVNGLAPSYWSELLEAYVPRRMLRSPTQLLLHEPKLNLKRYGWRAFSVFAPRSWNSLPFEIRKCDSIDTLMRKLKTHIFVSRNVQVFAFFFIKYIF